MAFCIACGARLPEAARFCPTCGAEISTEAPGAETLKLVTVLFADLVSSTARAGRMHPEDVRELLLGYFEAMTEEIEAEGGIVEKYVGDAIMAVFGVPSTHEDDPLRAVRAALGMLARLAAWNASHGTPEQLEIRIGIDTGEVLAAAAPRADLIVTGDAVNLAARLQEAAAPGEIVVGGTTARLVRRSFDLRELDPLHVKGKAESIPAWLVVGEAERERAAGAALSAPMVGRDRELAVLHSTLERVEAERKPRLVTVRGDPGVGKSRLVSEFVASLHGSTKVLVGRCSADGKSITLKPLGEILASEAAVLDDDPPEAALAKIGALVRRTLGSTAGIDHDAAAVALASTLGLEPAVGPQPQIDPRETRRRLVAAWRALVTGIAAAGTLVVVVEDLHWGDPAMLDVIEDLADHVEGAVVFLCTARPDLSRIRPDWGRGKGGYSSVTLGPLPAGESERLVSLLLGTDDLPEHVRRSILERAEGNPFFLEEILHRLIDERLIQPVGGRWRVRGELGDLVIPETVQEVILARIDLLSPRERRALQEAAVVGRVFWSGAIARLVDAPEPGAILDTLRRRELIAECPTSTISGQVEYTFKHVLTRDVAYESLPRRERARAHARVASWIEEVTGKRSVELAETLAHHHDVAYSISKEDGLRRSARADYLLASQRALRRFALSQAEHLGSQAVRLSTAGPELAEALEALGDLFAAAHVGDAAWRTYADALAAGADDAEAVARLSAKAAVQATRWYGGMREHPTGEELEALIVRGLSASADTDSPWRALLLQSRGFELIWGYTDDTDTCRDAAHEALAIAERLDDPNLISGCLDSVGSLLLARGLYGDYLRFGRRRIELVPRLTDVGEIGDAYVMGAWSATYVGFYAEAAEHASACLEHARAMDPGEYVHGLSWRVWARAMIGDWTGAILDQEELERIQAEAVSALPVGYTLRAYSAVSLVHELRGAHEAADRYLDLVRQFVAAGPSASLDRGAPLALAARALAHGGHGDEARELLGAAGRVQAPPALEALCEIAAALEDWDAAPDAVSSARRQAKASKAHALPFFADRLEGRVAGVAGDTARAAHLLRRSAAGFAGLGARWEEAWSRQLLSEALVRLSDRGGARRERTAARAVFERLGSVEEVARSRAPIDRVSPANAGRTRSRTGVSPRRATRAR